MSLTQQQLPQNQLELDLAPGTLQPQHSSLPVESGLQIYPHQYPQPYPYSQPQHLSQPVANGLQIYSHQYSQPQHNSPQPGQQQFIQPYQHASQQDVTDLIVSTTRMLHSFVTTTNTRLDAAEKNIAKMCEHMRTMVSQNPGSNPSSSSSSSSNSRQMALARSPKATSGDDLQASLTVLYLLRYGTLTNVGHVAMVPMTIANRSEPQLVISVAIASKFLAAAFTNRTTYSQARLQKIFAGMGMLPFTGSSDSVRQAFYSACCAEFGIPEGIKNSTNLKTEKTRQQKFLVVPESKFYAEVQTAIATCGDRHIPFKMLFVPDATAAKPTKRKSQYTTAPFSAQCANGVMWSTDKIRNYSSFQRRKYDFIRNHTPWSTPGPWSLSDEQPLHLDQDCIPTIAVDNVAAEENLVREDKAADKRPFYSEKRPYSGTQPVPSMKKRRTNEKSGSDGGSGSSDGGSESENENENENESGDGNESGDENE